jgi:hypothetical protein
MTTSIVPVAELPATDLPALALARRFDTLRATGRKALVCYMTAGHPDVPRSIALLQGLEAAGADVIEVGVPFSDPMADGPVIQRSSQIALTHGVTLEGTLDIVRQARLSVPVVLFTYLNPLIAARTACCSPTCRSARTRREKRGSAADRWPSSDWSHRRRRASAWPRSRVTAAASCT